jgi:hypothetical protein
LQRVLALFALKNGGSHEGHLATGLLLWYAPAGLAVKGAPVKHLMLALVFVFTVAVNAQEAAAPPVTKELLPLEKARVDTLCKGDLPGLEKLFASDMTYVHSNGVLESRTEFLDKLRTGERKYVSMEHDPGVTVRSYGDVAILTGSTKVQVIVKGQTQNVHLRFTEAWQRQGKQWQVVAWQATKIAE